MISSAEVLKTIDKLQVFCDSYFKAYLKIDKIEFIKAHFFQSGLTSKKSEIVYEWFIKHTPNQLDHPPQSPDLWYDIFLKFSLKI